MGGKNKYDRGQTRRISVVSQSVLYAWAGAGEMEEEKGEGEGLKGWWRAKKNQMIPEGTDPQGASWRPLEVSG